MKKILILIVFLLACFSFSPSGDYSHFFGYYKGEEFSFKFYEGDVRNLIIQNKKITSKITIDEKEMSNNRMFLDITYKGEEENTFNYLNLCIYNNGKTYVSAGGFYVQVKIDDDGTEEILTKFPLKNISFTGIHYND